jgi:hypothetical protein
MTHYVVDWYIATPAADGFTRESKRIVASGEARAIGEAKRTALW